MRVSHQSVTYAGCGYRLDVGVACQLIYFQSPIACMGAGQAIDQVHRWKWSFAISLSPPSRVTASRNTNLFFHCSAIRVDVAESAWDMGTAQSDPGIEPTKRCV